MLSAWPWPESIPVHFGRGGRVDRTGSPWELVIALFILPLGFVVISFLADEHWARRERRKRFNWISLIDEVILSNMTALAAFSFGDELRQGTAARFSYPWLLFLILAVGSVGLGVVLELRRPWRPEPGVPEEPEDLQVSGDADVLARTREGRKWAYFESQNPLWISAVILLASLSLLVGAWNTWNHSRVIAIFMACMAALMMLVFGGFRSTVSSEGLKLRLGILGIRLLRIERSEIREVVVHQFSPLADFGGWGIRRGKGMWGYFLGGNRGVKIVTAAGKKYLIGSDTPDRLAAVLQALKARG